MKTEKIREELEKLKVLANLYTKLCNSIDNSKFRNTKIIKLKIITTKEEMIKSNYRVGQMLKKLEEKV